MGRENKFLGAHQFGIDCFLLLSLTNRHQSYVGNDCRGGRVGPYFTCYFLTNLMLQMIQAFKEKSPRGHMKSSLKKTSLRSVSVTHNLFKRMQKGTVICTCKQGKVSQFTTTSLLKK